MRKKKHSTDRLMACERFLYTHEGEPLTSPAAAVGMPGGEAYLEIGAGKGRFAAAMAERNPRAAYFAMERVTDCVVLAAELAASGEYGELNNLHYMIETADELMHIFAPGSLDAIFLNFSDPWPKKGYAKRRLTHRRYLSVYFNLLKDGGKITFKTDNVGLFDFTLLEYSEMGITPDFVTRDLHNSSRSEGNVMTEYETNFSSMGMAINMVEVTKPDGFLPEIDESFNKKQR